jgi:tRNA (adenine57-N1/adenine58-N1)-methyltransferase
MQKKVLIRLPRKKFVEELGRDISLGEFEKHIVKNTDKPFSDVKHTLTSEQLQQEPCRFPVKDDQYIILNTDFLDEYKGIKRLAQIITLKDIGRIITLLGINRDSVVVEAGSGSGAATVYLASIAKEVHTYEINDDHLAVAKDNVKEFNLSNVTFYRQSIYEEIMEHNADAFLLDVPEPKLALTQVEKTLRIGGRCVMYTPNLTQAADAINHLPQNLLYEGTLELTERNWEIKERILRPRMQGLGHTAFLTILRKMP